MEKPSLLLRRRLLFASLSLLAAFAVAGGAWADASSGLPGVAETGVKLLLILALCALLLTQKAPSAPRSRSVPARWALWGLLPPAVVLASQLGPLGCAPSAAALFCMLFGVLTTALWEELFFRALGQKLFLRDDGRYRPSDVLFLTLAFALPHAVNYLIHPAFWQLVWAACAGLFFLALYRRTGSLTLVVLSHALTNALSQTIALCTAGESHPYLGAAADAVSILGMAALAAAGLGILLRGDLLAFRKETTA